MFCIRAELSVALLTSLAESAHFTFFRFLSSRIIPSEANPIVASTARISEIFLNTAFHVLMNPRPGTYQMQDFDNI